MDRKHAYRNLAPPSGPRRTDMSMQQQQDNSLPSLLLVPSSPLVDPQSTDSALHPPRFMRTPHSYQHGSFPQNQGGEQKTLQNAPYEGISHRTGPQISGAGFSMRSQDQEDPFPHNNINPQNRADQKSKFGREDLGTQSSFLHETGLPPGARAVAWRQQQGTSSSSPSTVPATTPITISESSTPCYFQAPSQHAVSDPVVPNVARQLPRLQNVAATANVQASTSVTEANNDDVTRQAQDLKVPIQVAQSLNNTTDSVAFKQVLAQYREQREELDMYMAMAESLLEQVPTCWGPLSVVKEQLESIEQFREVLTSLLSVITWADQPLNVRVERTLEALAASSGLLNKRKAVIDVLDSVDGLYRGCDREFWGDNKGFSYFTDRLKHLEITIKNISSTNSDDSISVQLKKCEKKLLACRDLLATRIQFRETVTNIPKLTEMVFSFSGSRANAKELKIKLDQAMATLREAEQQTAPRVPATVQENLLMLQNLRVELQQHLGAKELLDRVAECCRMAQANRWGPLVDASALQARLDQVEMDVLTHMTESGACPELEKALDDLEQTKLLLGNKSTLQSSLDSPSAARVGSTRLSLDSQQPWPIVAHEPQKQHQSTNKSAVPQQLGTLRGHKPHQRSVSELRDLLDQSPEAREVAEIAMLAINIFHKCFEPSALYHCHARLLLTQVTWCEGQLNRNSSNLQDLLLQAMRVCKDARSKLRDILSQPEPAPQATMLQIETATKQVLDIRGKVQEGNIRRGLAKSLERQIIACRVPMKVPLPEEQEVAFSEERQDVLHLANLAQKSLQPFIHQSQGEIDSMTQ